MPLKHKDLHHRMHSPTYKSATIIQVLVASIESIVEKSDYKSTSYVGRYMFNGIGRVLMNANGIIFQFTVFVQHRTTKLGLNYFSSSSTQNGSCGESTCW